MAIRLDGSGGYTAQLAQNTTLAGNTPWTVGCWVRYGAGDYGGAPFSSSRYYNQRYYLRRRNDQAIFYYYLRNHSNNIYDSFTFAGYDNWFLALLVNDPVNQTTRCVFCPENGAVQPDTITFGDDIELSEVAWGDDISGGYGRALTGDICQAFILQDSALSDAEIEQLASGKFITELGYSPFMYLPMDAAATTLTDQGSGANDATSNAGITTVDGPGVIVSRLQDLTQPLSWSVLRAQPRPTSWAIKHAQRYPVSWKVGAGYQTRFALGWSVAAARRRPIAWAVGSGLTYQPPASVGPQLRPISLQTMREMFARSTDHMAVPTASFSGAGLRDDLHLIADTKARVYDNGAGLPIDFPQYRIVAAGQSASAEHTPGLFDADGNALSAAGRSYNVAVFDKARAAFIEAKVFDVFASDAAAMAAYLNALPADGSRLVIIFTDDEPERNRLSGGLDQAMYGLGATPEVFGGEAFYYRGAYVLVGEPGLGEGGAYFERYMGMGKDSADAWIDETYPLDYTALPFQMTLAGDKEGSIDSAQLSVDNVSREIPKVINDLQGPPDVRISVLDIAPDQNVERIVGPAHFRVNQAQYDVNKVSLTLGFEADYINEPAIKDTFNNATAPGLFQ